MKIQNIFACTIYKSTTKKSAKQWSSDASAKYTHIWTGVTNAEQIFANVWNKINKSATMQEKKLSQNKS